MVSREHIQKIIEDSINKCFTTFYYVTHDGKRISIHVREVKKPVTFVKHLHNARQTIPTKDRWRVLEPSREKAETKYLNTRMFVTRHGSTIAIDENNTIISVCSYKDKNGKSYDNAGALMSFAVNMGGDKLDTFDGNYTFYRYLGFEPVSWIKFDDFDTSNIPEWVNGHNRNPELFTKEDIIFFKYTGKQSQYLTSNQFTMSVDNVDGVDAYEQAAQIRDEY